MNATCKRATALVLAYAMAFLVSGCPNMDLSHMGSDKPEINEVKALGGSAIRVKFWPDWCRVYLARVYAVVPTYRRDDGQIVAEDVVDFGTVEAEVVDTDGTARFTIVFGGGYYLPTAIRPGVSYYFHVVVEKSDGQVATGYYLLRNGVVTADPEVGRAFMALSTRARQAWVTPPASPAAKPE